MNLDTPISVMVHVVYFFFFFFFFFFLAVMYWVATTHLIIY